MILPITIGRVRTEIPIRDILGKMGTLKRSGNHEIMVCFVHDDHRPSLDVYADRNYCICRSCGWSADVIGVYQKIEELRGRVLSFADAVRELAAMYNIPVLETPKDPKYAEALAVSKKRTEHAFALHRVVADAYQAHLELEIGQGATRTTAFAYFQARGIHAETMKAFHLGGVAHTSNALVESLAKNGYSIEDIKKYSLFRQNRNRDWESPIHDRVVYPLQNHMGEFVGFAGRKLPNPEHPETDKIQKYINSQESDIYHKHQLLYGMYQANKAIVKHKQCFIVEGYQDVLAMHQAGVRETIAVCGTALTQEQVRLLRRFNDQVILMLDGDAAGQKAMRAHLKVLLQAGMYVDVVVLPDGQDPDDFIQGHQQASVDASVDASTTDFRESLLAAFAEYKRDWLTHCCTLLKGCGAKALRTGQDVIFELLAAMPDRVRQETATKKAAGMMGLSVDVVALAIKEKKAVCTQHKKTLDSPSSTGSKVEQKTEVVCSSRLSKRLQAEKNIIRHLVLYGTYRSEEAVSESALANTMYQALQNEGITLQNTVLQDMLEALYKGYTDWETATDACEEVCNTPYLLVGTLQSSDSTQIGTCATRIYEEQMRRELTFGESACPGIPEVLETAGHYVEVLKKEIVQERIAELSKLAEELMTAEVVDEGRYREVMRELRGISG